MITIRLLVDSSSRPFVEVNVPDTQQVRLRVVAPTDVQRSTGTLRVPEAMVDLTATLVDEFRVITVSPSDSTVVGLLIHAASYRATAIGTFAGTAEALDWWNQSYNRLAHNADVLFVALPIDAPGAVRPL